MRNSQFLQYLSTSILRSFSFTSPLDLIENDWPWAWSAGPSWSSTGTYHHWFSDMSVSSSPLWPALPASSSFTLHLTSISVTLWWRPVLRFPSLLDDVPQSISQPLSYWIWTWTTFCYPAALPWVDCLHGAITSSFPWFTWFASPTCETFCLSFVFCSKCSWFIAQRWIDNPQ